MFWDTAQLDALDGALERARGGQATWVWLTGDAGMGKSSLLAELVDRAGDFDVRRAAGFDAHLRPPFDAVRQWGVAVEPDGRGVLPEAFGVAQQLRETVDDATREAPLLLVLDDAQWADPESLESLWWTLRRAAGERLLVAVGTRPLPPEELGRWGLLSGEQPGQLVRLTLDGLTEHDAIALARQAQPTLPVDVAREIWRHTQGNPRFVSALLEENDTARLTHLAQLRALPAPMVFTNLMSAKLSGLPATCRTLLGSMMVLGPDWVSLIDAMEVGGLRESGHEAVEALRDVGLVDVLFADVITVRRRNGLIDAVLREQVSLEDMRRMHARAATRVSDPSEVLRHRLAATERYDDGLADELEEFSRLLHVRQLHRQAAQHVGAASSVTSDPAERTRRWLESMYERLLAGDTAVVRAAWKQLERTPASLERALVTGLALSLSGELRQARDQLEAVPTSQLDGADPAMRSRHAALLAETRLRCGATTESVQEALDQVVPDAVDPSLYGRYLMAASHVMERRAGPSGLAPLADLPEDPGSVPADRSMDLLWRGAIRAHRLHVPGAVADLREASGRGFDVPDVTSSFNASYGLALWLQGDWTMARLAYALGNEFWDVSPNATSLLSLLDSAEGRAQIAEHKIGRVGELVAAAPYREARLCYLIERVVQLHAIGDEERQQALYAEVVGDHDPLVSELWPESGLALLHLAVACWWGGRLEEVVACADLLLEAREPAASTTALRHWLLGLVAVTQGRHDDALDLLTTAADDDANDLPLYRAHILADRGRLALRMGRVGTGNDALNRAHAIYTELGAQPYVDRLDELQARRPVAGAPTVAWHLTEREHNVLTLVVAGLSYAQISRELFITQSTVSYHLSNIYSKTGVGSRHELTDLVRRQPELLRAAGPVAV